VTSEVKNLNGVRGLYFVVQGAKSPPVLEGRVERFLTKLEVFQSCHVIVNKWLFEQTSIKTELEQMSAEEFSEHKESLATVRLEKPKTLGLQSAKFWAEIEAHKYHFDRGST